MSFPRLVKPEPRPGNPAPSLAERSDDDLMRLSRAGMREAFAVLVERYAARVVQTCARFVNDFDAGRELAQETWVAVWQERERYHTDGGFVPWLVTLARNKCRNYLRGHRRAERHAPSAELADAPSPQQIDALLVAERRAQVHAALSQLSPALREALLLRYGEELRYEEMVQALSTGQSTLRSRVHHGLKQLREILEKK
ncbi:MAG: sigma-70 family RNA polymerase sigma factor [Polyangiaceae bacterium]